VVVEHLNIDPTDSSTPSLLAVFMPPPYTKLISAVQNGSGIEYTLMVDMKNRRTPNGLGAELDFVKPLVCFPVEEVIECPARQFRTCSWYVDGLC